MMIIKIAYSLFNNFYGFQGIEDEDRQWNEKPDDEEEFDMPYSFVSNKKLVLKSNRDITLPSTVSLFKYIY